MTQQSETEKALVERNQRLDDENRKLKLRVRELEGEVDIRTKATEVQASQMEALQAHADRLVALLERERAIAMRPTG